jgi:predicted nucleic acid-binding protein
MKKEQLKAKLRIYIDTSIAGGYFEDEFEKETKALFQRLVNKEVIFVVSEVLEQELEKAPQYVRELINNLDDDGVELVELTAEAEALADAYIEAEIIGIKHLADCQHIAIATINRVSVLASWNFKHIVNFDKIRMYNSINLRMGYNIVEIRNPKELINYEIEF